MKHCLTLAAVAALSLTSLALAEKPQVQNKEFPTPAELVAKMKSAREQTAAKLQVAYFDFIGPIAEAPSGPSLFGGGGTTLRDLVDRLRAARYDDEVGAVLMTFKPGSGFGTAQAEEITAQINGLKEAGKKVFVYADSYDPSTYLVASAATDVCLMEGGEVFLPGVSAELMFYKGLFDKVGITPSYVQVGEFKGAEEPYVNNKPSPELAQEMESLVNAIYDRMVTQIASNRSLSKETVRKTIDDVVLLAANAKEQGYVDHLVDADGIRDVIAKSMEREGGDDVNLISDYAEDAEEEVDFSNIFAVLARMNEREPETDAEKVALVYASGVIVDGESGGGGIPLPIIGGGGATVGSETIRRAMREIERDDLIKSVVIRIDSPGGSALASEAMWQAVRRVAQEKPVIISVGGMAASGGYYLLAAGDHVYADPSAIVGSIGVVGGKLSFGGIYEKLGLTTTTFNRGAHADLFSSTEPWDEREKKMVRAWMQQTYDQFTDRVMEARGDKIEDIDKVAKGRIFLAADALELGMVDELGGLEDAIAHAAGAVGFTDTNYEIKVVPEPQFDPSSLFGGLVQTPVSAESQIIWSMLPNNAKVLISRQLHMTQLMQDRPVVLLSPWIVNID